MSKTKCKPPAECALEIVPARKGKSHTVHVLQDGDVILSRQGALADRGSLVQVATALAADLDSKGLEIGVEDVTAELERLWLDHINDERERERQDAERLARAAAEAAAAPEPPDPSDVDARAEAL